MQYPNDLVQRYLTALGRPHDFEHYLNNNFDAMGLSNENIFNHMTKVSRIDRSLPGAPKLTAYDSDPTLLNDIRKYYDANFKVKPSNTSTIANLNPSNIQSTIINTGTGIEDVKDMLSAISNKNDIPAASNLPIAHPTANANSYSYVGDVHRYNPPNWTYGGAVAKEATEEAAEQATKKSFGTAAKEFGGKVGAKAKNLGGKFTSGVANTAKNFFNPQAGGWISYGFTPGKSGGFGKTGLNIGGQNIGKWGTIGAGVMQGLDAIGGLSEMSNLNADADDLESQILASAAGNPLLSSYLTSDDLALLGKLQRGSYDGSAGLGDATSNLSNLLSGAASGAMTGAIGGLPGILIGGIGGLINSGIDNMNSTTSQNTARLEALYQNLLDAEQQYKSMKRPNFTGLGIQQRYQNMYA